LAFGSIYGYRYSQELHAGQGFQFHFRRSYIHTEREEVPQDLVDTPLEEISHRHSTYPLCHDITSFTTPTHDVHNTRSSCDRGWGTLASNLFLLLYSCSYIDDPCIESPYTFTTPWPWRSFPSNRSATLLHAFRGRHTGLNAASTRGILRLSEWNQKPYLEIPRFTLSLHYPLLGNTFLSLCCVSSLSHHHLVISSFSISWAIKPIEAAY